MDTEDQAIAAPRFSKKTALEVLDASAHRIATAESFNRSHGTAQLRAAGDQEELIRRAVEYGRMRAYERFAEAIEEGFRFEERLAIPETEHEPRVLNVLVHFDTVTLTFPDNAAAHFFAAPFGAEVTRAILAGRGPVPAPNRDDPWAPKPEGLSHRDLVAAHSRENAERRKKLDLPSFLAGARVAEKACAAHAASAGPSMAWEPISTAPKDGTVILCDDTNGSSQWAAAKWLAGDEWSGWVYDDEVMNDSCPLGPNPTKWLRGLAGRDNARDQA